MVKVNRLLLVTLAAASSSLGALAVQAASAPTSDQISNFHVVDDGIFRGGRPTEDGMNWLAQNQITTDIDLEDDMDAVQTEQGWAEDVGIQFLSFPMGSYSTPDDDTVNEILEALSSNSPVFIHCHYGENRTGLIVALFRVNFDGWSPQAAFNEMKSDGFTWTGGWALLPYFDEQTGFVPPFPYSLL